MREVPLYNSIKPDLTDSRESKKGDVLSLNSVRSFWEYAVAMVVSIRK